MNDRTIRGYASAVYAAAERFGGNQDGAKQHLQDALEVIILVCGFFPPTLDHFGKCFRKIGYPETRKD